MEHRTPGDIERTSMAILTRELMERGAVLIPGTENVVRRVIHATADFDYAENLRFTEGAVEKALEALRRGTDIVTDTNMTLSGVSKAGLQKLGCRALCFMAEPEIAELARQKGTTRAVAAMDHAALPKATSTILPETSGKSARARFTASSGLASCSAV